MIQPHQGEEPALSWPAERAHLADVPGWLARTLDAHQPVAGPERVPWVKAWGVTALFVVDGQPVVFKDASPVLFPAAADVYAVLQAVCPGRVPQVLAHERFAASDWFAFEYVGGPTVREAGTGAAVTAMARALAGIQRAVSEADRPELPGYDVARIPDLLADDLADQPADLRAEFMARLPVLREAAAELAAAIPPSIDHPDLNPTNAILRPDGSAVLIDWEEASVGCPFFSVDRMTDAGFADEVVDCYLRELPWGTLSSRQHCYRLSYPLVPLRRAAEARAYARALNRPDPHTQFTARLLAESLRRLTQLSRPAR
jgi:aminoglycoside phosphotransferase (APT) family kinase protein